MKNIFSFILLIILTIEISAQENKNNLQDFFKIEFFVDKIAIGYEMPVTEKILIDLSMGMGAANDFRDGTRGIKWADNGTSYLGPFIRGQARYYFNRERRGSKGHSILNNVGSFLGFQSKFNFNGNKDIGKVWLNEFHFGQQLPWGKNIFFRYHAGLGYGYNFGEKYSSVYPALGVVFGYAF